ncbi:MAG TPA: hypothetical protein VNJ28_00330, partial [Candidatus Limnocylindrales bacterium]|nr:hypothetical protein [Candidatus Limnocylindrales bacterium]
MSTAAPPAARPPRLTTERARAFVASRRPAAAALGAHLADLVHDPEAFVRELRRGLAALADPDYRAAQASIAPGIVAPFGVRRPLLGTVLGRFRR